MKTTCYLVVNSKGSVRALKSQPNLNWDEISIGVNIELPDSLFRKPQISGKIVVKEEDVTPFEINAEIQNNIAEAVKEHAGVDVKFEIVKEED